MTKNKSWIHDCDIDFEAVYGSKMCGSMNRRETHVNLWPDADKYSRCYCYLRPPSPSLPHNF